MLYEYKDLQSRAANGENQRGEKGQGGMARGGRKGCPSISPMRAGKTYTLLDAQGSGMVRHIWCTFPPGDPKLLRNLILRSGLRAVKLQTPCAQTESRQPAEQTEDV